MPSPPYQTRLRIDLAGKRLSAGTDIVDVALEAGFTDQSHFTKKFKQFVGTTPRRYKIARGFSH